MTVQLLRRPPLCTYTDHNNKEKHILFLGSTNHKNLQFVPWVIIVKFWKTKLWPQNSLRPLFWQYCNLVIWPSSTSSLSDIIDKIFHKQFVMFFSRNFYKKFLGFVSCLWAFVLTLIRIFTAASVRKKAQRLKHITQSRNYLDFCFEANNTNRKGGHDHKLISWN